jgi:chemotaxis protein methyltransferase CheR
MKVDVDSSLAQAPNILDRETFERIRDLVYAKSGIVLKDDKATLVSGRLARRLRELRLDTARDYLEYLARDRDGQELTLLLDAISTNVTSFYREAEHFELIGSTYAAWLEQGQRRFRFWCAAASSGEEPYTLAMTLLERSPQPVDLRILATDISTAVLGQAVAGVYSSRAVAPIPKALLARYFSARHVGPKKSEYTATEQLRQPLSFRYLNLAELPCPLQGPLDMILCRNVMIYFDQALRARLVSEFHRLLKPGGFLLVSHSESLVGLNSPLRMIRPSVYVKTADAGRSRV